MKRRTLLAGGLAGLTGTSAVTACGGGAGGDADDLATVRMMVPLFEQAPAPDGALQQAIQQHTGKTLDITWVLNSNYGDRTNVVLASDDIPEVFVVQSKGANFVRSAQAGAFWDLTDKLDAYENLRTDNPTTLRNSSVNGTVYGIYRARDAMRTAVIFRKDWLAALGLSEPETVDDFYTTAKAIVSENPGRVDNPTAWLIPAWSGWANSSPYDVMDVWHGAPNGWGERDGKLVPAFDTEEFFASSAFVKKMIDEGLVNADFATLDSGKWNDAFFTDKGGLIIDVSSRGLQLLGLYADADPDDYADKVDMVGNLVGPPGQLLAYPTTGYNGIVAISRQSVPSEEELADVLTVLDKLNAKEGQVLLNNGIEGQNFTVTADGFAEPTNEDDPANEVITNDVSGFAQLGMAISGYTAYRAKPAGEAEAVLEAKRLQFHERDLASAVHNPTLPYVSETYVAKGAQLDLIIGDSRIKYLAGDLTLDELRGEIERWHSSGGDDVVAEMNELHAQNS